MSKRSAQVFEFGPFRLNRGERLLLRDGFALQLTPKAFDTLVALVERGGQLVEKDELMELVWTDGFVEESNLTNNVYTLRKVLGQGYIETIPTRGYRFTASVREVEPEALVVEKRTLTRIVTEETESESTQRKASFNWRVSVWAFAFVALGGFVLLPRINSRMRETPAMPFASVDVTRFTTSGRITHAAISPDGKYVAHIIQDGDVNSLWIRHTEAPSQVRLVEPAQTEIISAVFAPDSQSVYYIALDRDKGDSRAYRVPVLGGPAEFVAEDFAPIGFSPDGRQIAFLSMHTPESTLVVAKADGSNRRVVAELRKPDFFAQEWNAPAWSPDGRIIACPASLNDPKGRYETIVGVRPGDGKVAPLTSKRWSSVGQAVWLPDGSGLVLAAKDQSSDPLQVWLVQLTDGATTRITRDVNNYRDISLSKDGLRLCAVQSQEVSGIWVAPASALSRTRRIASESGYVDALAWTPDGRIAYISGAGGSGADIWIMKADGSDAKQITVGARAGRGLTVTPDGRRFVFTSDRSGRSNLWSVDADGGNLRQLTAGNGEFYPQCSPDGQWVVFQRGDVDPWTWRTPLGGGAPELLSETRASYPAVSPDGRSIAYSYLGEVRNGSRWGIGLISSDGGPLLKRFDFPPSVTFRSVRWSPDSQSVAFVNNEDGRSDIWLQPLAGSPSRQLTDFGAEQILSFDWSPNGQFLTYVRYLETSDVVLIEQP